MPYRDPHIFQIVAKVIFYVKTKTKHFILLKENLRRICGIIFTTL